MQVEGEQLGRGFSGTKAAWATGVKRTPLKKAKASKNPQDTPDPKTKIKRVRDPEPWAGQPNPHQFKEDP